MNILLMKIVQYYSHKSLHYSLLALTTATLYMLLLYVLNSWCIFSGNQMYCRQEELIQSYAKLLPGLSVKLEHRFIKRKCF